MKIARVLTLAYIIAVGSTINTLALLSVSISTPYTTTVSLLIYYRDHHCDLGIIFLSMLCDIMLLILQSVPPPVTLHDNSDDLMWLHT